MSLCNPCPSLRGHQRQRPTVLFISFISCCVQSGKNRAEGFCRLHSLPGEGWRPRFGKRMHWVCVRPVPSAGASPAGSQAPPRPSLQGCTWVGIWNSDFWFAFQVMLKSEDQLSFLACPINCSKAHLSNLSHGKEEVPLLSQLNCGSPQGPLADGRI